MSDALHRLSTGTTALLVVDMQERLLPAIHEAQQCEAAVCRMIRAAKELGIPVLATEQYPAGLGRTCPAVRAVLGDVAVDEKVRFSACVEPFERRLAELKPRAVLVVGIEAHVCVQQTVLDLLRLGCMPYVCADAVSSRRSLDRDIALARMRQAGATVTTVESAIFELLGQAGTDQFKQILKIVK